MKPGTTLLRLMARQLPARKLTLALVALSTLEANAGVSAPLGVHYHFVSRTVPVHAAAAKLPAKPPQVSGNGNNGSIVNRLAYKAERGSAGISGKSYQPAASGLNGTTIRGMPQKGK